MKIGVARTRLVITALCLAALPTAASADDSATKTGIYAGLGLTAAKGQTTLGTGAGVIEAASLNTASFQAAALEIERGFPSSADHRTILVVTKDQNVDLSTPVLVRDRIQDYIDTLADPDLCKDDLKKQDDADNKPGAVKAMVQINGSALTPIMPSDFAQALMTDISINPITLTADDRMLVNALLMRPDGDKYHVAGEAVALPTNGTVYQSFRTLVRLINARLPKCVSKEHAAMVAAAQTFVTSLTTADKGALSALATAMQYEPFASDAAKLPALILRVAIEQDGGTAITRQNIFYELGLLQGAATVSSGLVVSYRLIDPQSGTRVATGVVWCLRKQVNLRKVRESVAVKPGDVICSPVKFAS